MGFDGVPGNMFAHMGGRGSIAANGIFNFQPNRREVVLTYTLHAVDLSTQVVTYTITGKIPNRKLPGNFHTPSGTWVVDVQQKTLSSTVQLVGSDSGLVRMALTQNYRQM